MYLGIDPNEPALDVDVVHLPFIEIIPRDFEEFTIKTSFADISEFSHILFTSKNAVRLFFEALSHFKIQKDLLFFKQLFAIGNSTSRELEKNGCTHQKIASLETQEGIIDLLELEDLKNAYIFYPRSSKARPALSFYLRVREIRHQVCDLYDTKTRLLSTLPTLETFDEIVFTSPTTVEAFFSFYSTVPNNVELKAIGPITQQALSKQLFFFLNKQ